MGRAVAGGPDVRGSARFDAIVLAGGRASRFGGIDKTGEVVAGRTLLSGVVTAAGAAKRVIVCGGASTAGPAPGARVLAVSEVPPHGGPAHGVAAALALVTQPTVVLLAADLPFVTAAALAELVAGLDVPGADAVVAVDDAGREQYLLAAWDASALRAAIAESGDCFGLPLRALYARVRTRGCALAGTPPPWWDCDTAEQLDTARRWSPLIDPPAEPR